LFLRPICILHGRLCTSAQESRALAEVRSAAESGLYPDWCAVRLRAESGLTFATMPVALPDSEAPRCLVVGLLEVGAVTPALNVILDLTVGAGFLA